MADSTQEPIRDGQILMGPQFNEPMPRQLEAVYENRLKAPAAGFLLADVEDPPPVHPPLTGPLPSDHDRGPIEKGPPRCCASCGPAIHDLGLETGCRTESVT